MAAVPLVTAGFYSKDMILWQVWSSPRCGGLFWTIGAIGAGLTAFYAFRVVFAAFGGKENTAMPWMVIYPLGRTFSYDPDGSQYKSSAWIVANLVDSVAKGGNFMVGIGPDGSGRFHPEAVRRLEEAGQWLEINGEAIFGTRPWVHWQEGDDVRFTLSGDGRSVYAIILKRPGASLHLSCIKPVEGCQVSMPGAADVLPWLSDSGGGITIETPQRLLDEGERSKCATWVFKISGISSEESG